MGASSPSRRPNRIVERDPYSRQYEIWHAHDAGDPRELHFELPRGISVLSVEHAIRQFGQDWIEARRRDGLDINAKTIRVSGPFPCMELEKLDLDLYIIEARFRRAKPLLVKGDQAREWMENQPQQRARPLEQDAMAVPHLIEANARATVAAKKQAKVARSAWDEMERERAQRGTPQFVPDLSEFTEETDG